MKDSIWRDGDSPWGKFFSLEGLIVLLLGLILGIACTHGCLEVPCPKCPAPAATTTSEGVGGVLGGRAE